MEWLQGENSSGLTYLQRPGKRRVSFAGVRTLAETSLFRVVGIVVERCMQRRRRRGPVQREYMCVYEEQK